MDKITTNLKLLRKSKKLRQLDLANHLSMSIPAYSKCESGGIKLSIEKLILVADLYSISLDDLVGREFAQDGDSMRVLLMRLEAEKDIKETVSKLVDELFEAKKKEMVKSVMDKIKQGDKND